MAAVRKRIQLFAPPYTTAAMSGWALVDVAPTGCAAVLQKYPDLTPAIGWHLVEGVNTYEVSAVNGQGLTCELLAGVTH
jgi:hypothetical protein